MTRQDIEAEYDVENGRITSPGKFEGEPVYVPHFWEFYLNGFSDDDDDGVLSFNVDEDDRREFPELKGVDTVQLYQSDNGFVFSSTLP